MKKFKNLKITTNQFLAYCEKTGDPLGEHIVSNFIASMKMVNPNMKHMTGADWLSVFLNDFYILFTENDIQVIPNSQKVDFELHTEFNA